MAATPTRRPEAPAPNADPNGARSDVWPVQRERRERVEAVDRVDPSPAAYAIHDAKNMVGILAANVEALREALEHRDVPGGVREILADLDDASQRLGGLLREALDGLQGREPPRSVRRPLRVGPIVTAAVDRMRPPARARGVRIVESGSPDARATIEADLFERVLVNLLENAVRFSQPGDSVEVEYENRRGRLTVAVGDRGPGVPEDAREQIFESYRSRAVAAAGDAQHFGLGLAFCREVARAHGGDAWVFNREEGGACFVFEIE